MDQGIQTFRMLLVPHQNGWRESNIVKLAEEFSAPLIPIYQGIHGGSMPKSGSFLSSDSDNVLVTSVKLAEDSDDIIVRCVETIGKETSTALDLKFANRHWKGNFRPYEIKTLRVNNKTKEIKEVSLLEENI
jgi:alpha-mannosidase